MADHELKANHDYQTVIGNFPKAGIHPVINAFREEM